MPRRHRPQQTAGRAVAAGFASLAKLRGIAGKDVVRQAGLAVFRGLRLSLAGFCRDVAQIHEILRVHPTADAYGLGTDFRDPMDQTAVIRDRYAKSALSWRRGMSNVDPRDPA